MLKQRDPLSGGMIPTDLQSSLVKGRQAATVSYLRVDRNKWFVAFLMAALVGLCTSWGWFKENKRFAENVRVAYVKMYSNGHYEVDYDDADKPVDFFSTTVESKLSEFVEKRYSKKRDTITTDYGFAKLMMSAEMQTDFMQNYKAADEAARLVKCSECEQITTKIREQQPLDKDPIYNSRKRQQYTTLVFTADQVRNKEGKLTECRNKIVKLIWIIRPVEESAKRRSELRYNPLGQEIIASDVRDDPTPISLRDCIKL